MAGQVHQVTGVKWYQAIYYPAVLSLLVYVAGCVYESGPCLWDLQLKSVQATLINPFYPTQHDRVSQKKRCIIKNLNLFWLSMIDTASSDTQLQVFTIKRQPDIYSRIGRVQKTMQMSCDGLLLCNELQPDCKPSRTTGRIAEGHVQRRYPL